MTPDLAMLAAVFVSVSLTTATLASAALRRYSPERKRLRQMVRGQEPAEARASVGLTSEPSALAEQICRILPRSPQRMGEMRARLVAAGYRSQAAPVMFAASQIVASLVIGTAAFAITSELGVGLMSMVAGFAVPGVWLSQQIRERARTIRNGLPDVLDLLIVCLESGCSLDQAVLRSAEDLGVTYKALADELALVANEIRAGTPRTDAFRHFAERTREDDVRAFVAMLVQTDRYGTSVAPALRVHADLLRTRRRQRAEERAAKANVKLVVPLVLCLFPAFYILCLGPAMLKFVRVFQDFVNSH